MHSSHPLRLRIEKNAGYMLAMRESQCTNWGSGPHEHARKCEKKYTKETWKGVVRGSVAVGGVSGKST